MLDSPHFALVVLISMLGLEARALLRLASQKPLWYDELLTFYVSNLKPFSLLWRALHEGVDGMPPGYYVMVRMGNVFSGDPHIILRLPSIFGYMLTLLGVYWFARKRLPGFAGLAAALLIALSPFRQFAVEARSYALLTGFLAISAAVWQRVDDKKPFIKPLFAFFLALAVSCHYYAVITIAFFGIAELTQTRMSGRIRWGVWAALLVAAFPFFLDLPILLHFREVFGKTFWSKPTWLMAAATYPDYLGISFNFALLLLFFFTIVFGESLGRSLWSSREGPSERDFSPSELVLICGFLFYPAALVVLTKLLGGGYTPRYGWPAIFGLVLALVYSLRTVWPQWSTYLMGALLIIFSFQEFTDWYLAKSSTSYLAKSSITAHEHWTKLAELSQAEPGIPVVIGSSQKFLEAAKYAPSGLRERLVEVFDADIADRLVTSDTTDRANRLLRKFVPLPIEDLSLFQAVHPRFLLRSGGFGDWVTPYLLENKYRLTFLSKGVDWSLYVAER
jgi:hypothetical protein